MSSAFCLKDLIVHCDILLVGPVSLFRALYVCAIRLEVRSEREMAFMDWGRVEIQKSWDGCVGLGSVVNRILLGLNSFTMSWAASSKLSKLESLELA